jgi:cation transport regulator ChaB
MFTGWIIMPYSSVSELPPAVKKLPPKQQRRWMHVFNSAYRRCKAQGKSNCEEFAFRNAWGTVKSQGKNMDDCMCEESLTHIEEFSEENLAKMPSSTRSGLPNAAFAVVEPCWQENKAARHLPHHKSTVKSPSENSSLDMPHLRNALARMNQVKSACGGSDAAIRSRAKGHLSRHAKSVLPSSKFSQAEWRQDDELLIAALDEYIALIEKKDIKYTVSGWRMDF